ncbi:peptidase [Putridiphycobacter roseus]|uniref:Peptidase n=1 Tax=Putridiphycobacter roseus TaxID=2219161 RepID=A0A2W1NEL4_9FLAO|nr:prolyl oligopeptidase family serine peptidase [Putridiphycobacter roseus]PZE17875.1 peptidase [Putridiphycobacter roseus]
MKKFKTIIKILGLLLLLVVLFVGFKFAKKYYASYQALESLNNTVLGIAITADDLEASRTLAQGEIQSKRWIDLSEIAPLWKKVTENDVLKSEFEYLNNIDCYAITYKSDSLLVNGIIVEPKREGKFPVIIFNRGGNKAVGKDGKLKTLYSVVQSASILANEGYVVIASCYREKDEFGGKDLNDVLNLIKTAADLEKGDSERIGMFGWSRGGMMTYLALKNTKHIKTAVVGNGPTDLERLILDRPEMETEVYAKLIPNYEKNKAKALASRSAIYWTNELDKDASLLILCGTEDQRVNPEQAENIAEKLKEIDYNFTLKKFKTDHKFSDQKKELDTLLIHWFNEKL